MAEHVLDVAVMAQERNRWCWAAVAAGVAAHLHGITQVPQCQLAATVLGISDCCANPLSGNVEESVATALNALNVPARMESSAGLGFAAVSNELIQRRLPIAARMVDTTSGLAHFVLLIGCDPDAGTVVAADPWGTVGTAAPRYRMPFHTFRNSYGGWGACSDVCRIA
jgi:hypothetical protein